MGDMGVGSQHWYDQKIIDTLHGQVAALTMELAQYRPLCLLCGRDTPCMTNEEGMANGGPGRPCTFDPTPAEMVERIKLLQRQKRIHDILMTQGADKIDELREQVTKAKQETAEVLSTGLSMALRGAGMVDVNTFVQKVIKRLMEPTEEGA